MSKPDRAHDGNRTYAQALIKYNKATGSKRNARVNELRDKLGRPVNREEMGAISEGVDKELGVSAPKKEDY